LLDRERATARRDRRRCPGDAAVPNRANACDLRRVLDPRGLLQLPHFSKSRSNLSVAPRIVVVWRSAVRP